MFGIQQTHNEFVNRIGITCSNIFIETWNVEDFSFVLIES